ncbi:MAG: hybrid sensor histidine kinase/response regulator, partial [Campylobacterota bacterium]|nr:hybrid sensor histidine kinase/response regulator [Campylobacterota bacterium]
MKKVELEDLIEFSKTIKVLYVEGQTKVRESSYGVFKIFFEDIDTAKNAQEGYECFLNNKYNLIITDVNMPHMSGIDMISKIREISKDITILIISSDEDKEHFMKLISLGIDGYILKPVEVKQFVEVLQKIIEKFQNKQKLFEYKNNLEEMVHEKTNELLSINNKLTQSKAELEILNNSLEKQIKVEVEKNIQKEKELFEQSKLASMGEMIGNIAHQWRQPLSAITTSVGSMQMQKELGILEDKDFDEICNIIVDNATYLSTTIEDFRNFAKGQSEKKIFNIKDSLNSVLNLVSPNIKSNYINIELDVDDDIIVNGYQNELNQTLMNLFNNAKDALQNIEGDRYIFIKAYKKDDKAVIEFKDNAGGISEDIINRIFEPYFTTKHQSKGTGLGLSMTYKIIVDGMRGKIFVSNSEQQIDDTLYI